MTKIKPLKNILFVHVAILFCIILQSLAALSDKQLCYDPNCSEIISLARTVLAYRANDPEIMSFKINTDVKVFSKGAGHRTDLWGVEINGQRGYVPKMFLHEYKILHYELSHEVPVYKFSNNVQKTLTKKFESTEEVHKSPALKDKPSHENKIISPLIKSIDENVEESKIVNADNISPSYEVIDGTTIHFESKSSVEPSFVTEAIHATALPNEQSSFGTDSNIDFHSDDNKNMFSNDEQLRSDTNDVTTNLVGVKSQTDIHKDINTNELLESSEAIINSTLDTVNEDDILFSNINENKFEENDKKLMDSDIVKDVEHHKKEKVTKVTKNKDVPLRENPDKDLPEASPILVDNNPASLTADINSHIKNIQIQETVNQEEVTENIENEGIIASLAKKFTILSNFQELAATAIQNSNDMPIIESIAEDDSQFPIQVSKDMETEENIPLTQTELNSDINLIPIDTSIENSQKEDMHEENMHKEDVTSKEEIKPEVIPSENAATLQENIASSNDVPSLNNFVHEDVKSAEELLRVPSVLANDIPSIETDTHNYVKNIKVQERSIEEKTAKTTEKDLIASIEEESTVSVNLQETESMETTSPSSNHIDQEFQESSKINLGNVEKVAVIKETVAHIDEVPLFNKTLETDSFQNIKEISENITEEAIFQSQTIENNTIIIDEPSNYNPVDIQISEKVTVHSNVNKNDNLVNDTSFANVPTKVNEFSHDTKTDILHSKQSMDSSQERVNSEEIPAFNEYPHNHNLLNIEENLEHKNDHNEMDNSVEGKEEILSKYDNINNKIIHENEDSNGNNLEESKSQFVSNEMEVTSSEVCLLDHECTTEFLKQEIVKESENENDNIIEIIKLDSCYWKTLMYLSVTAFTMLIFTLGYYYIENIRRDGKLIARINKLEKELLVSTKECEVLTENLKLTKEKLHCIEDESFGSNEMVISLKADLETSQNTKEELEDQVSLLEKDLESATEVGLELERMLREVLSSKNEVNPLAQSVEDLQARLNAQQTANESLTNALNIKAQEVEILSANLVSAKKKCEKLEVDFSKVQNDFTTQQNLKSNMETTLTNKIDCFESQIKELSTEKLSLYKELRSKEIEVQELKEVINTVNSNNLDLEKLYDVSRVKTEVVQLREERDELKMRLNDVEGAHHLLEEHMQLVKEEIVALNDQCKIAEKEKKDAETRLEVLSNFFKEKEAERQKEEAVWLEKQGEVVSTVERIHTLQNEIQNYKQQVEILKREIMDQEREYKNQISILETKAHEHWVTARQNERRLEESKAEAGQLRNRLTLVEKSLNDVDSEAKLHRLETNGETVTSPPLFIGAESSNSPVMFSGSSGVPPPPPSYLHCFPYLPPLPPTTSGLSPYDISQRPPPLGGRLSSPPPMPLHPPASSRYENAGSPPPPMSPHLLPPFNRHRSPPPPFGGDHIPPPPPRSILPPPLGTTHPWGEESLPPPRNSGFHPHQREQRTRNHKGSLHSSGESLDKTHHGKV